VNGNKSNIVFGTDDPVLKSVTQTNYLKHEKAERTKLMKAEEKPLVLGNEKINYNTTNN
jgi:hypothetical protein